MCTKVMSFRAAALQPNLSAQRLHSRRKSAGLGGADSQSADRNRPPPPLKRCDGVCSVHASVLPHSPWQLYCINACTVHPLDSDPTPVKHSEKTSKNYVELEDKFLQFPSILNQYRQLVGDFVALYCRRGGTVRAVPDARASGLCQR